MDGTWPENDLRRAFVAGAKWWEFYSKSFLLWSSDVDLAEKEANRRYPQGCLLPNVNQGLTDADFNMRTQFYEASKEHKEEENENLP